MRPELPISLEECWLYEAVTNCYLPLLELISSLPKTIAPMLAVSLSPTLLELWSHPQFAERYAAHIDRYTAILEREENDASLPFQRRELAHHYRQRAHSLHSEFLSNGQTLPDIWASLARAGKVELLTTAATHAFLPAYQQTPLSRRLQIQVGVETFEAHTGLKPTGFWLPECAYYPGLENDLAEVDVEWFAVENMGGPTIRECPNGIRAIARNGTLSRKVWDARVGYPGNAHYREFHHDAVTELSAEQAGLYRLPNGDSLPLGLKYWRVTGSNEKDWYDASQARIQAEADAADFVSALDSVGDEFIFLPFDAELFGHWWHEGPHWLQEVLIKGQTANAMDFASPTAALAAVEEVPVEQPAASTWGRRSDYSFWINNETDWIYPLLQAADRELGYWLEAMPVTPLQHRAIQQLTRELLLAQASDWPFMLRAGATAQYAEERLRRHLGRFQFLLRQLRQDTIDLETLTALEQLDPIFPDLNLEPDLYFQA